MAKKTNIILIPLDNRPVSYTLPVQTALINQQYSVFTPPKEFVGGLDFYADTDKILNWLEDTLKNQTIDFLVCCLDTIAYGGLIPSRRSFDDFEQIQERLFKFKKIIENCKNKPKIYAFSSIMRISNNNVNEEEKLYWDKYGELIFKYSYLEHKSEMLINKKDFQLLDDLRLKIPDEILKDYFDTRKRNFDVNKEYINWVKEGFFEYFVYSQDDTAKYGLNVQEKNLLLELIEKNNLQTNASIKTGADEIPICLTIRGIKDLCNTNISIFPMFFDETGKNVISRYEDVSIENSAKGQISLCGCKVAQNEAEADILLIVNTPKLSQNDHAMKIYTENEDEIQIQKIINLIKNTSKPFIIADVKFANGADHRLVQELLNNGFDLNNFYAFAGWNTTGNTLGSAISMAVSRFLAEKENFFDDNCFKNLLFIRFADDWGYQTVVRQIIRNLISKADEQLLYDELKPYLQRLCKELGVNCDEVKLSFPWNRTFELEIEGLQ